MQFISLIDTSNHKIITIDVGSLLLRIESEGSILEARIKPFMVSVLYEMFNQHPNPLPYDAIMQILKEHDMIISDYTRMHRKISEIRQFIQKTHKNLGEIIINSRGFGYSLPLRFKNLHHIASSNDNIKFKNLKLTESVKMIEYLINDSIELSSQNKVVKHHSGYVINRDFVRHIIIEKIAKFNECEGIILKEIRAHEADFTGLRINYMLAKLKTYIGLARISEYPISEAQWLDWFSQEVWMLFEELKKAIRFAENV